MRYIAIALALSFASGFTLVPLEARPNTQVVKVKAKKNKVKGRKVVKRKSQSRARAN